MSEIDMFLGSPYELRLTVLAPYVSKPLIPVMTTIN